MALVGSFAAVFNAAGRIVWGTIADKFSFRVSIFISNFQELLTQLNSLNQKHCSLII